MRDFQEKLNDEIEKRGLNNGDEPSEPDSTSPEKEKPKKSKKKKEKKVKAKKPKKDKPDKRGPSLFSFSAFIKGLVTCALFLTGVLGWAWWKADDTQAMIWEKLPSKTAIVSATDSGQQATLSMPPVKKENSMESPTSSVPAVPTQADMALKNSVDGKDALVQAPIPGLYETVSSGLLPIVRQEDGLTPFEAYKKPFEKSATKPIISFMITDIGLSRAVTEKVIKDLPPEVTLAFSPYTSSLRILTDVARHAGHEVWISLPLETQDYPMSDPGPSTLLVNASVEQNKMRLTNILGITQGYAGFVTQKDHAFRQEDAGVNPSIEEIFNRGLAIIDSNTSVNSFVSEVAKRKDFPHAKGNFWLDEDLTPLVMNQKIRQVMEYAQGTGGAIVLLRPYPASLKALEKFLNSAASKEYQIAPVSALVKHGG